MSTFNAATELEIISLKIPIAAIGTDSYKGALRHFLDIAHHSQLLMNSTNYQDFLNEFAKVYEDNINQNLSFQANFDEESASHSENFKVYIFSNQKLRNEFLTPEKVHVWAWLTTLAYQRATNLFNEKYPNNTIQSQKDYDKRYTDINDIQLRALNEILTSYHNGELSSRDLLGINEPRCVIRIAKPENTAVFDQQYNLQTFSTHLAQLQQKKSKTLLSFKRLTRNIYDVPEEVFELAERCGINNPEDYDFILRSYNDCVQIFLEGPHKEYIENIAIQSLSEWNGRAELPEEFDDVIPFPGFDVPHGLGRIFRNKLAKPIDLTDLKMLGESYYGLLRNLNVEIENYFITETGGHWIKPEELNDRFLQKHFPFSYEKKSFKLMPIQDFFFIRYCQVYEEYLRNYLSRLNSQSTQRTSVDMSEMCAPSYKPLGFVGPNTASSSLDTSDMGTLGPN